MCDEVRREIDGRGIIIGATNRGPQIPDEDIALPRIGFYIEAIAVDVETVDLRLICADTDHVVFNIDLEFPNKKEALKSNPNIDFSRAEINLQLMVNQGDVNFKSSGRYRLEYKTPSETWNEIRSYLFSKLEGEFSIFFVIRLGYHLKT
jgi:hypothetical protein